MSQFYRRQTINQSSIIFYLQNEKIHTIVNISTHVAGLPEKL